MSTSGNATFCTEVTAPPTKTKRSFFQRLSHGTLSLHIRSKRNEKQTRPQPSDSSNNSRNTSVSLHEVSVPPSTVSTTTSERNYFENGSRYYDIDDDDVSPTSLSFPPGVQHESDFEVPIRYVVARNGEEENHEFKQGTQGMQGFVFRKQVSVVSTLNFSSHTPPFCATQRSSKSSSSEMSDEQMDKWLDEPEDVEIHRERKASAESLKSQVLEAQKNISRKSSATKISSRPATRLKQNLQRDMEEHHVRFSVPNDAPSDQDADAEDNASEFASIHNKTQKLLALPDELLYRISSHLDASSTWFLRLSCERLYDVIPAPGKPEGSPAELRVFFDTISSFLPSTFQFCEECKIYHSWKPSDNYLIGKTGSLTERCRRYLDSGAHAQDDLIGAGKFICEHCNRVRTDRRCRTCDKCVSCARLRRTWMLISWVEEECDYCAASRGPK